MDSLKFIDSGLFALHSVIKITATKDDLQNISTKKSYKSSDTNEKKIIRK